MRKKFIHNAVSSLVGAEGNNSLLVHGRNDSASDLLSIRMSSPQVSSEFFSGDPKKIQLTKISSTREREKKK
jgi:hypothetical protein